MEKSGFYKVYVEAAGNRIVRFRNGQCVVFYGHGTDEHGQHYTWRQNYSATPSPAEVVADIAALVNAETDSRILSGLAWQGKPVWLSTANQLNFRAALDTALRTDGANLPLRLKLGEQEGRPVYHTFTKVETLEAFVAAANAHIAAALADGWAEKDSLDPDTFQPQDPE